MFVLLDLLCVFYSYFQVGQNWKLCHLLSFQPYFGEKYLLPQNLPDISGESSGRDRLSK